MSTLLAAITNDACAEPELRLSSALGALLGADVRALHVSDAPCRELRRALAGLPVTPHVVQGPVVETIISAARDADVVALVLGSRGARDGPRPVGTTAGAVITRVGKPVIVVAPEARPIGTPLRILVPLEDEPALAPALTRLASLARAGQLKLVVVHVHAPDTVPAFSDHAPHSALAWEREFLTRHLGPPHRRITLQRRLGTPADEICTVADTARCDLIALTWSQDLSSGHAAVISGTLSRSAVPVLLLPVS